MRPTLFRFDLATPVGDLLALASDTALCGLDFRQTVRLDLLDARMRRFFDAPSIEAGDSQNPIFLHTRRWLERYFAGEALTVADAPPLDLRGTPFERQVWELLCAIPSGARVTYGDLAERLRIPAGARAVGGASRRNPIAIIVPCHRVIGKSGDLTGYGGGLANKEWLLSHERRSSGKQLEMHPL